MSSPTLKVEIAFTSEPLDTTPTWVDVSAYVRATSGGGGGVSISRGHGPEIGPFEAGSCTVTLSNRDRRFDPSYSAGPNFGNLIPRKQIRITATWATVDYVQFTGWVTGWPQGFTDQGKDATVTIEAIDSLAMLANMSLERDLLGDYASTLTGLVFFLSQADVERWTDALGNFGGTPAVFAATPATGSGRVSASLAPGMNSTSVQFSGSTIWTTPRYSQGGAWSLSFWMQTTQTVFGYMITGKVPADFGGNSFSVGINPTTGHVVVGLDTGSSTSFASGDAAGFLNDGVAHHVVITADGSTLAGYFVYVDGVDVTFDRLGDGLGTLEIDLLGGYFTGNDPYNGSLQDIVVWDRQITALEVETWYHYSAGFFPESSADRVTRYLDDAGWPATWREITTNPRASVGELVYGGAAVLPKLQEVERSEQGMLFATKAGNIAFRERFYANEVTVGNTVQQIFSDDNGATAIPYSTFGFQYNDIDVTNSVSVTTPTTWAKSSDATSITVNGLQSKKVDTILSTFDQANVMAAGLVAKGKDATYRVPPIMSYPENNTTRWDEVLGLELGYRVSMEITPMGVGSQNVQEVTLEQIEWTVVDSLWSLTVAGSPCFVGGASEVGWFTIGTSLIGGPDVIGF